MARAEEAKRVTVTLSPDEYQQLAYWAASKEMSVNEYLKRAIEMQIKFDLKDYPLPELEVQRLNQLVDVIMALSSNMKSLEDVVVSGFTTLTGLTRGDNYLLDEDGSDV